jgi:hypothetical protein
MEKVQKLSNSVCYTPPSELNLLVIIFPRQHQPAALWNATAVCSVRCIKSWAQRQLCSPPPAFAHLIILADETDFNIPNGNPYYLLTHTTNQYIHFPIALLYSFAIVAWAAQLWYGLLHRATAHSTPTFVRNYRPLECALELVDSTDWDTGSGCVRFITGLCHSPSHNAAAIATPLLVITPLLPREQV